MERDELVEVYSTDNAQEAEILRNALRAEGIRCEIEGESQAGLTGMGIMPIKLVVRAEDYDRARGFIEQHERD